MKKIDLQFSDKEIKKICWNPSNEELIALTKDIEDNYYLQIFFLTEDNKILLKEEIKIKEKIGLPIKLKINYKGSKLLFSYDNYFHIFDFETNLISSNITYEIYDKNEIYECGFYYTTDNIWLLLNADSGSGNLLNYYENENRFKKFELQEIHDYGRGISIHPSDLLILTLWSGTGSYGIVQKFSQNNEFMEFFSKPEFTGTGYELYFPTVSKSGEKIAFINNPFVERDTIETLRIFDLFNSKKPEKEFILGDYNNKFYLDIKFSYSDNVLAICEKKELKLFFINSGKIEKVNEDEILEFSAHDLFGLFAYLNEKKLTVLIDKNSNLKTYNWRYFNEKSKNIANNFINHYHKFMHKANRKIYE
jgi:hypothetical protein